MQVCDFFFFFSKFKSGIWSRAPSLVNVAQHRTDLECTEVVVWCEMYLAMLNNANAFVLYMIICNAFHFFSAPPLCA